MNLKHRSDGYPFTDSSFQMHKELFMDRYLLANKEKIEERTHQVENMKRELEETINQIDKIVKFQVFYGIFLFFSIKILSSHVSIYFFILCLFEINLI